MRYCFMIIAVGLAMTVSAGDAQARLDLYVDKSSQRIAVVQDGYMRYVWPVSTGRDADGAPSGVYSPERLERNWFSREYYDSPMPYAIFFRNGYAIHGSYDITRLGGPASHGCIRLYPQDAALLFAMVEQEGPENTTIVIGGDGQQIPRAPRYRDMNDLVRSAAPPPEGALTQAPPPPVAPPPVVAPMSPPRPRATPSRDVASAPPPARPNSGNGQPAAKSVYRAPPRSEPSREVDHGVEAPPRQGTDVGPPAANLLRELRNEPRRDADRGDAPTRPATGNPQPVAAGANRPHEPRNEPNREADRSPEGSNRPAGDNSASGAATTKGASRPSAPRSDTDNAHETAHSEPASNRTTASAPAAPESTQSSFGYKVLPKSYWTGASWRWRANGEPEAQ
jgi:L,D-transpeptidase catalytic domain